MAGIFPKDLAAPHQQYGMIPFVLYPVRTVAGTATYYPLGVAGDVMPRGFVVTGMGGIMTGAGGAGDTIRLFNGSGNAITEAVDVSALTTDDIWACSTVDLTYGYLTKGSGLYITTASGATSLVIVYGAWTE